MNAPTFEETQKRLTEYANSLEEVNIFIHRDLETLPKVYVDTVNDYLTAVALNIKYRKLVEEFELKYEKARGELFDHIHTVATEEIEVNEYGEIVSKRENNKGVKLKSHTFYEMM